MMNKSILLLLFSRSTHASTASLRHGIKTRELKQLDFDEDVTPDVIFGAGNANGAFTIGANHDIELGLRAKLRYDATCQAQNTFNSNGDGTYSFPTGDCGNGNGYPVWSFEWSINAHVGCNSVPTSAGSIPAEDCITLNAYDYELKLDADPSYGTLFDAPFGLTFDPINVPSGSDAHPPDHPMGTDSTKQGGGSPQCGDSEETWGCGSSSKCNVASDASGCLKGGLNYTEGIDHLTVAQNSWQYRWFVPGFLQNLDKVGIYTTELLAKDKGKNNVLASTKIVVLIFDPNNQNSFPQLKDDCKQGGWERFGLFSNNDECVLFTLGKFK